MAALRVPDAAKELGLGVTFTRQLISRGELRHARVGRRVVVPEAAISEFLEAHSSGGVAAAEPPVRAARRRRGRG